MKILKMTDWSSYTSIRERYNNMFNNAIKRLQKRCPHIKKLKVSIMVNLFIFVINVLKL